jgi:pilus assembly protein CpaF
MRPDRIIVGEVRGPEAFDMMQAMNTGHEGSVSTVHANTPRDALARLENMILMANLDLPSRAIREQIASAVHLILQVSRFSDGSRKVTHISEVAGMEGQVVTMQDIFRFEQTGIDTEGRVRGAFRSTGIRPRFVERFESLGIQLSPNLFSGVAA